jgi:hypothetical protein
VSPILVRPVREQLEHDRLIRHLQQKYKRKFDVAVNIGDEQGTPVKIGALLLFPDLVLISSRKLAGVIEVETGESVNNLEAMAQWAHFARARVPFHLYVPVTAYEAARRLCEANHAQVSEVWTYRPAADGFDLVRISTDPSAIRARGPMATLAAVPPKPAPPPPPPVAPPPAPVKAAPAPPVAPPPAKSKPPVRPVAAPSAPKKPAPAKAAPTKPAPVKPTPAKPAPAKSRAAAKPVRKPAVPARKPAAGRRKPATRRR